MRAKGLRRIFGTRSLTDGVINSSPSCDKIPVKVKLKNKRVFLFLILFFYHILRKENIFHGRKVWWQESETAGHIHGFCCPEGGGGRERRPTIDPLALSFPTSIWFGSSHIFHKLQEHCHQLGTKCSDTRACGTRHIQTITDGFRYSKHKAGYIKLFKNAHSSATQRQELVGWGQSPGKSHS